MKNFKKGFTLIELLVVVAIIGILASVVLASLNSARNKGADAAVKANMANIRAQAELFYDNSVSKAYNADGATALSACSGGMFSDPNVVAAIGQIQAQAVAPGCVTTANGQKWAMWVTALKGGGNWCVDNSGWAKVYVTAPTTTTGACS